MRGFGGEEEVGEVGGGVGVEEAVGRGLVGGRIWEGEDRWQVGVAVCGARYVGREGVF